MGLFDSTTTVTNYSELPESYKTRLDSHFGENLDSIWDKDNPQVADHPNTVYKMDDKGNYILDEQGQRIKEGITPWNKMTGIGMSEAIKNDPGRVGDSIFNEPNSAVQRYGDAPSTYKGASYEGIENYINPYLDKVLTPILRSLNKTHRQNLNRIDASRHAGGAFGDARHGIADSAAYDRHQENVADVVGRVHADAFDKGLSASRADKTREETLETQRLERKYKAAANIQNMTQLEYQNRINYAQNLINLGLFQKAEQEKLNEYLLSQSREEFDAFVEKYNIQNVALTGKQLPQTQKTVTKEESNPFAAVFGQGAYYAFKE